MSFFQSNSHSKTQCTAEKLNDLLLQETIE